MLFSFTGNKLSDVTINVKDEKGSIKTVSKQDLSAKFYRHDFIESIAKILSVTSIAREEATFSRAIGVEVASLKILNEAMNLALMSYRTSVKNALEDVVDTGIASEIGLEELKHGTGTTRSYYSYNDNLYLIDKIYSPLPDSKLPGLFYSSQVKDTLRGLNGRAIMGIYNINKLTGHDMLSIIDRAYTIRMKLRRSTNPVVEDLMEEIDSLVADLLMVLSDLADVQTAFGGYVQQVKYLKERKGEIATVRDLKKGRSQNILDFENEESVLAKMVGAIELDNDTSIDRFKVFEKHAVKALAKIGGESKKICFKVRYLGKHRASGLFIPFGNILAIDVNNGGTSFIHELGHFIDLAVLESISTRREFTKILRHYKNNYNGVKPEYYTTPTEVFARCFEVYWAKAVDVEGDGNNIVYETDIFTRAEYEPILEIENDVVAFMEEFVGKILGTEN